MRLAILCLVLLTGCVHNPHKVVPPDIQCVDFCRETCPFVVGEKNNLPLVEPPLWEPRDPDNPEAWDEIRPQVVIPLETGLAKCELARQSCVQCIDDYNTQLRVLREQK